MLLDLFDAVKHGQRSIHLRHLWRDLSNW